MGLARIGKPCGAESKALTQVLQQVVGQGAVVAFQLVKVAERYANTFCQRGLRHTFALAELAESVASKQLGSCSGHTHRPSQTLQQVRIPSLLSTLIPLLLYAIVCNCFPRSQDCKG